MVIRLSEAADPAALRQALEAIFFAAAARTSFASAAEQAAFLVRWTGWYLEQAPDDVWFWQEADGTVAGYLTGCRDSAAAGPLYERIPFYRLFADLFPAYPAHLHVNCRPERRGLGIGARLVAAFAADCAAAGCAGVHVVTAAGARNSGFYRRNGFAAVAVRPAAGRELLFMGRDLRPAPEPP